MAATVPQEYSLELVEQWVDDCQTQTIMPVVIKAAGVFPSVLK